MIKKYFDKYSDEIKKKLQIASTFKLNLRSHRIIGDGLTPSLMRPSFGQQYPSQTDLRQTEVSNALVSNSELYGVHSLDNFDLPQFGARDKTRGNPLAQSTVGGIDSPF